MQPSPGAYDKLTSSPYTACANSSHKNSVNQRSVQVFFVDQQAAFKHIGKGKDRLFGHANVEIGTAPKACTASMVAYKRGRLAPITTMWSC
jgi:hypothetical protein